MLFLFMIPTLRHVQSYSPNQYIFESPAVYRKERHLRKSQHARCVCGMKDRILKTGKFKCTPHRTTAEGSGVVAFVQGREQNVHESCSWLRHKLKFITPLLILSGKSEIFPSCGFGPIFLPETFKDFSNYKELVFLPQQ